MNKKILYLMVLVCYGFSIQIVNAQVTQVSKVMAQYEDAFFSKIESISDNYNNDIGNLNLFYIETLQKYMRVMQSRGALMRSKKLRLNLKDLLLKKHLLQKMLIQNLKHSKRYNWSVLTKLMK